MNLKGLQLEKLQGFMGNNYQLEKLLQLPAAPSSSFLFFVARLLSFPLAVLTRPNVFNVSLFVKYIRVTGYLRFLVFTLGPH